MIDSRQASFRHTPADTALAAAKPKDQSARRTGSRGGHPEEDSPVFPVPGPVLPWKQRAQAAKKVAQHGFSGDLPHQEAEALKFIDIICTVEVAGAIRFVFGIHILSGVLNIVMAQIFPGSFPWDVQPFQRQRMDHGQILRFQVLQILSLIHI